MRQRLLVVAAVLAGACASMGLSAGTALAIDPPAPPCIDPGALSGLIGSIPGVNLAGTVPVGACGVSELPATGAPWLGNMAYYGGHVQVHPREYIVFWGWGQPGAFPGKTCTPEDITEGTIKFTLPCDPDGAGKYIANFVQQMGGTNWQNVQTQYYQTDPQGGGKDYISNDKNMLAGVWVDNSSLATMKAFNASSGSNPAGPTNTYWMMAQEANAAAAHFHVYGNALPDANFIIFQPAGYTDPNALADGYCAFHDYTEQDAYGNGEYAGLTRPDGLKAEPLVYTNEPYVADIGSSCGQDLVNAEPQGALDPFSISLGHEINESATDPGAEDEVSNGVAPATNYGGWYDVTDADENGDKCAYVGDNPVSQQTGVSVGPNDLGYPGSAGNITGNGGKDQFAVQSLWSNADDGGTGYCAGVDSTNSPVPAQAYSTAPDPTGVPALPSGSTPAVDGTPAVGGTLTADTGSWSNKPTDYVYQWERCDASGANCFDIDGATTSTYTPTLDDLGSTLVVTVAAANPNGSSLPVASAASDAVSQQAASTGSGNQGSGSGNQGSGSGNQGSGSGNQGNQGNGSGNQGNGQGNGSGNQGNQSASNPSATPDGSTTTGSGSTATATTTSTGTSTSQRQTGSTTSGHRSKKHHKKARSHKRTTKRRRKVRRHRKS